MIRALAAAAVWVMTLIAAAAFTEPEARQAHEEGWDLCLKLNKEGWL